LKNGKETKGKGRKLKLPHPTAKTEEPHAMQEGEEVTESLKKPFKTETVR